MQTLLAIVLIAMAAGCAVSPEQRAILEPQTVALEPQHGLVMLKVASNRNVDTFFAKWQSVKVREISSDKTHWLSDRSPPQAAYSLYVGSLPPGKYVLEKFDNQAHGAISIFVSAALGAKLGRFEVKEGRITDLGSLIFLRDYYPVGSTRYRLAFAQVPLESALSLAALDPAVAKAASGGLLGWLPEEEGEQRNPLNKASEAPSLFLNDAKLTADATLLAGEALGRIAQRDSAGRWAWLDTGTINTILSVQATQAGGLLAGSEQSILMYRSSGTADWSLVSVPLQDASIRFLAYHEKIGQLVVAQDRRNVVVLATGDVAHPEWRELRRIPVELFMNPQMDTRFLSFVAKDKLYVVTISTQWTTKVEFHILDLLSGTWTQRAVDLYALNFSALVDGSVYSMAGPNISQSFRVSTDEGASWDKRDSPNYAHSPVFRTLTTGYLIRMDSFGMFDGEKNTTSVWKTTNVGKTWEKLGASPNLSSRLILLPEDGHMLLVTFNGKLYRSEDDGATWMLEREILR